MQPVPHYARSPNAIGCVVALRLWRRVSEGVGGFATARITLTRFAWAALEPSAMALRRAPPNTAKGDRAAVLRLQYCQAETCFGRSLLTQPSGSVVIKRTRFSLQHSCFQPAAVFPPRRVWRSANCTRLHRRASSACNYTGRTTAHFALNRVTLGASVQPAWVASS